MGCLVVNVQIVSVGTGELGECADSTVYVQPSGSLKPICKRHFISSSAVKTLGLPAKAEQTRVALVVFYKSYSASLVFMLILYARA